MMEIWRINSSDTEIVVIEDYNTTGLVGDVNLLLPDVNKKTGEYEKSTDENTFYWFQVKWFFFEKN